MHTDLNAQVYTQTLDIRTIYGALHILNYIAVYIYFTNVCNIYTVWKQQPYLFQAGEEIILYSKHPAMEEQLRFSSDWTCLPENFCQV